MDAKGDIIMEKIRLGVVGLGHRGREMLKKTIEKEG